MNNIVPKYFLLIVMVFQLQQGFAGIEPAISVVHDGKFFINYNGNTNWTANSTFQNIVSAFSITPAYSFPSNQHVRRIDNMLELSLNPNSLVYIDFAYSLEVVVDLTKYEPGNSSTTTASTTLKINYDPKERTKWVEKANFHFENCGMVIYKVISINLTSPTTLSSQDSMAVSKVVSLRSDIIIERYLDFDENTVLGGSNISSLYDLTANELEIKWNQLSGAEYYDLEWAYVDDYGTTPVPATALLLNKHYNLDRNSTRIQTTGLNYKIPIIYERGYLIYRVRGTGKDYDPVNDKIYNTPGYWSNPIISYVTSHTQPLTVDAFGGHKYYIPNGFENDSINWQITTSYAEEGKSKNIISFRDGSERDRQTITGLSTEHETMVAEKIYDFQGRPAIEVLPVPANDPALKYFRHFNKQDAIKPYSRVNFDTAKANCNVFADPMDHSSGASRYYSSNNPVQSAENAYLPDAQGYPFIHTVFTPDNTGRIFRQSGVGLNHRIGSNHETKYFYGTPSQEELSMLFGIEVGKAPHYKQNVVKDPNGQLSVSYLDLKGKVIATALAGNPPTNLDSIPSYKKIPMNVDLMAFNLKDSINNELVASRSFVVKTESDYDFSYSLKNSAFRAALCKGMLFCYNCVYDLEIILIDNDSCNYVLFHEKNRINPMTYDAMGNPVVDSLCPKPITTYSRLFTKRLKVGSYTITKKLKVNQAATEAYVNNYLEGIKEHCTSVYDSILQHYLKQVDSLACEIKDSSKTLNRCEVARQAMLLDMSPGGQYGKVDWETGTASDPLSVFYSNNWLPENVAGHNATWNNLNLVYSNDNQSSVLLSDGAGGFVTPNALPSLQDFLDAWQPNWAEALLPFHPEYCYLEWCERDNASFDFDVQLVDTTTYSGAATKGYLSLAATDPELSLFVLDPYFQSGSGIGLQTTMQNIITNYYQDPAGQIYNMLEVAIWAELLKHPTPQTSVATFTNAQSWITAFTPNPAIDDTIWQRFRAMYLGKKEELQYKERWWYAMKNCTNKGGYNECIQNDYFNYHKNNFGYWIFNGEFFDSLQSCSWPFFQLYADKSIRFPSVYNIPVDFDPYKPAKDVIDDFEDWAGEEQNNICDTCQCPNKALTQFVDWIIQNKYYFNPGVIPLPGSTVFITSLQQQWQACYSQLITHINVNASLNYQNLTIELLNNSGSIVAVINLYTSQAYGFEIVNGISCIQFRKNEDGFDIGEATIMSNFLSQAQTGSTIVNINPTCTTPNCIIEKKNCPITKLGQSFGILLNTLISHDTLDKTLSVTKLITIGLTNYFSSSFSTSITWKGQSSGNTLTGTLFSSSVNCKFTLEFPRTITSGLLDSLGHIVSFAPDETQIDPATGYSYAAKMVLTLRDIPNTILIKVKSDCFPFSYCLKCPPPYETSSGPKLRNQTSKKDKQQNRNPLLNQPVGEHIGVDVTIPSFHDPNKICHKCDSSLYTLTYDSAGVIVHKKPPLDICDPCAPPLDSFPTFSIDNPCLQQQIVGAYANAANAYQQYIDSISTNVRRNYVRHCMKAVESFTVDYMDALHHFTLYYYDQANNLVKTVPPEGVRQLNTAHTQQAIQYMKTQIGTPRCPAHEMPSDYTFNSLNQLIKQKIPDHDGIDSFFYDYLSRIVVSQNGEQRKTKNYSYTMYDSLSRPYETGEVINASSMTDALAKNTALLNNWVISHTKHEITRTHYDKPLQSVASFFFNGDTINYRGRVASVEYYDTYGSFPQHSTHYQYDIHGNVKKLIQDNTMFAPKSIEYDYELISNSVKQVYYQRGNIDQYLHKYEYDADNRITDVYTSFDGFVWDHDADYDYYKHGALARSELGENKVHGQDFAYTIQGWIKGVNSGILSEKVDIGQDGMANHPHKMVPKDAFGYILRYYGDDYKMIGSAPTSMGWEPTFANTNFERSTRDLYNGNIQSMITALDEPVNSNMQIDPLGYGYTYDQINRITSMTAFNQLNLISNNWTAGQAMRDYATRYRYDANGNLDTLIRHGVSPQIEMDSFKYHYYPGRNQLSYVGDPVPIGNYPEDIDNQLVGNYKYDAIGNLIKDVSENLLIKWNLAGKVKSITKTATNELIEFYYDPTGRRVIKKVTNTALNESDWTYYVLDAKGNVMSIYTIKETLLQNNSGNYFWDSALLYGNNRIGEERIDTTLSDLKNLKDYQPNGWYSYRNRGSKYFELGNHLGNVLATASDRKLQNDADNNSFTDGFTADIWTLSDYYPFGSSMPVREFSSEEYKFGFNGMERENDIKGLGNQFTTLHRIYDPRLGKWLSLDPEYEEFPEFSPYNNNENNPILNTDPDGNCPWCILGAIVGAAVDYGAQVATNYASGNENPWTDVDPGSILISAAAGAATGGVSAFGKTAVSTTAKIVVKSAPAVIDAVQSVALQLHKNGEVSATGVIKDVVVGRVTRGAVDKIVPKTKLNTKVEVDALGRAKRVAGNNPRPSRANAVKEAQNNIQKAESKNFLANKVKQEPVKKIVKNTIKTATSGEGNEKKQNSYKPANLAPADKTKVKH